MLKILKNIYTVIEAVLMMLLAVFIGIIVIQSFEHCKFSVGINRFVKLILILAFSVANLVFLIYKNKSEYFAYVWSIIPAICGFLAYSTQMDDMWPMYSAYLLIAVINSLITVIAVNR